MQLTFENNKFHFATIQTPGPRLKLDHNSENRNWSEFFHTFAAFTPENFIKSIFGSIAFLKKSQADHALRWPLRSGRVNSICNFIHKVWNSNETSGGYQNFHSRSLILIFYHEDLSSCFNYLLPILPSNTLFADRSNIVFTFFCIFLYILQNVRKPRVNWALDSIWSSISFRGLGRVKDPEPRKTSAPAEIIRIGGPRPVNRGFTGIRY